MIDVVDLHCDTLTKAEGSLRADTSLQWDLERFAAGGGTLQVHAIFTPTKRKGGEATVFALDHARRWRRFVAEEAVSPVLSAPDLQAPGVKSLLALEDASPLAGELGLLDTFFDAGVRLITLVWSCANEVGRGVGAEGPPLTGFGRELIAAMAERGVAVDLSHASEELFWAVLESATAPPLCSHSNCRALCDHERNVTDDQIRALGEAGGIMALTFVPPFIQPPPGDDPWDFELDDGPLRLAEHARHAADLIGSDKVAVGSDFDGCSSPIVPEASRLQDLAPALSRVGFDDHEVAGILHGNALRYLSGVLPS